jgi:hypothetical protein
LSVILLSEALRILHSGAVCSLTYVAADRKRGTGGKMIHIPQCVIYSEDPESPTTSISSEDASPPSGACPVNSGGSRRGASHYLHKTRNIYIPSTRKIQKLHIKLITRFNGKKVLL